METLPAKLHQFGGPLPRKILVMRSLPGLGDLLCVVPALRALRAALPEAHVALIGLSSAAGFVQRFRAYLDELLIFPGYPGIPEVPVSEERTQAFLERMQQTPWDLALQMHGNGCQSNRFVQQLGTQLSAGFYAHEQRPPNPDRFLLYPEHEPEVWRHLRLMEFLGVPLKGTDLEFPLQRDDREAFAAIAQTRGLKPGQFVCLHPGASVLQRRWSAQKFAAIGDALAARGFQIVLTGTAAERELIHSVADSMRFPSANLAGETTLGSLAALLKHAQLLVCNDTGVSHLAAALRIPSVVIFSDSEPHRWAPLDRQRHRVVLAASATAESTVLQEALHLLRREVAYAS